jgi:peptide/nickel transport system substrate-binding protein
MRCLRRIVAVALALACSGPSAALAQGGALRVGLSALPSELDPATAVGGSASIIVGQVFDTLVEYGEASSDVQPALADQWTVSRDGLVWVFRLRTGVTFHDGTPLTAQQVVDSLDRTIVPGHALAPTVNPIVPRLLRGTPGVVKEVRATDARTVEIRLVQPYAPLLGALAHPALSIVLAAPARAGGNRWQGTGPFSIAELGGGRIVLEGRPGHWRGGPRLGGLVFVEALDESQAQAAVDAQVLDLFFPVGAPPRLKGAVFAPSWRIGYLALQSEKEPFKRVKARKAVEAALDAGRIAPALGPAASPLQAFLPRGVWGRRDAPPLMQADAALAKRLLVEAGLTSGTATSLLILPGDHGVDQVRVAEAIRASVAAAGITATIQTEAPDAALALVQNAEAQLVLAEARVEAGDPHFLLYPLSTSEGATKGAAATNFSFYRDNRIDDVLIRASQLFFRPERQRLYVRAQALLADSLPWIPLYVRLYWAVSRPELRNLRLHPSGTPRLDRVWIEGPAGLGK